MIAIATLSSLISKRGVAGFTTVEMEKERDGIRKELLAMPDLDLTYDERSARDTF